MAFDLPDFWVWDFWFADDGTRYHLYFLHAPRSLGHPDTRHRNARIGHASSQDLHNWTFHGQIFDAGPAGSFDDTATWTGSVVRGDDGLWHMFYTGSRFLYADRHTNIESVGVAHSSELFSWQKSPGPVLVADASWYEKLDNDSGWPEEAWRDPWVFKGDDGLWHMLVTARSNTGDALDRGVVGHAVSRDLAQWQATPPLSRAGSGFAHIEVLQIMAVDGKDHLIFSCDAAKLAGHRAGGMGGIWTMPLSSRTDIDISRARLLLPEVHYSGRLAKDRQGRVQLFAFRQQNGDVSGIGDPVPLVVAADGFLSAEGLA